MLQDLNMTKKDMAWSYSTSLTLIDLEPKGITKYTNKHTNIAKT